jgi:hypothetical protein
MNIPRTDGAFIPGYEVNDNQFSGVINVGLLLMLVPDPRDTENARKVDTSVQLQETARIRKLMQRGFEGAKDENVDPFSNYIENVWLHDADGITPPPVLYTECKLEMVQSDQGPAIRIPWNLILVNIDGETQVAAWHEAARRNTAVRNLHIPILICHGKGERWASQAFHDLNNLGVRITPNQAAVMDNRDPVTQVSKNLAANIWWLKDRVNTKKASLKGKDTELLTFLSLRAFVATVAKGATGVQYGSNTIPLNAEDIPKVERIATLYLNALRDAFKPAFEHHTASLLVSPTIFSSLGSLAFDLVHE